VASMKLGCCGNRRAVSKRARPECSLLWLVATLLIGAPTLTAADLDSGMRSKDLGDLVTAIRELRPLAEQGISKAQFEIGLIYLVGGDGFPKDETEAEKWFLRSASAVPEWQRQAESGIADAQYRLSLMYRKGLGVPKDISTSDKWLNMSAQQGYVRAQNVLGNMFANGQDTPSLV